MLRSVINRKSYDTEMWTQPSRRTQFRAQIKFFSDHCSFKSDADKLKLIIRKFEAHKLSCEM